MNFDINSLVKGDFNLEGEVWSDKFDSNLEIFIDAQSVSSISDIQLKAISQFEVWSSELFEMMEKPLFRYYQDSFESSDNNMPVINDKKEIWVHIVPGTLIVPKDRNENTYIYTEFGCGWEEEQGLTFVVKNGIEVIYVGPFDDTAYMRDGLDGAKTLRYCNFVE